MLESHAVTVTAEKKPVRTVEHAEVVGVAKIVEHDDPDPETSQTSYVEVPVC